MLRFYPLFILLLLLSCTEESEPVDFLDILNELEGVTALEITQTDHFERVFELTIDQYVDHTDPSKGSFAQKVFIGHIDEASPVIYETEGYSRENQRTRELAPLLDVNQISVEHRYYGSSIPSQEWDYLNVWQAATDHHRISTILQDVYSGAWLSSGVSKGGNSAIFHRRFYPDDVVGTVAFVAPILFEENDSRFINYYETAGDETCRNKLKQYQRDILENIDSVVVYFDEYINDINLEYGTNLTFNILDYKDIVYHAIREDYFFEFWSSEIEDCNTIPLSGASHKALFDHFVGVFDIFLFFSDWGVNFWTPYVYQAKTELGNYAFYYDHLSDLEMDIPPLVDFGNIPSFDPSVMADIQNWIDTQADHMIFIYGADDPWTVAAVDHPGNENMLKIVNPDTKHATTIQRLSTADRNLILEKINSWLGL